MERRLAECCIQITTRETFNGRKQTVQRPIHSISDAQRRWQRCVKCWMSFLQQVTHFNHSGSERKQKMWTSTYPAWPRPDHWGGCWHPGDKRSETSISTHGTHNHNANPEPTHQTMFFFLPISSTLCTFVLCALMQIITIFKWRIIKIEVQKDF